MAVLEYTGVTTLPRRWVEGKSTRVWVTAILEVRKIDGTESYAVADNVYGGDPHYKKAFGTASAINTILGIYPLSYLEKDYIPQAKNADELRAFFAEATSISAEKLAGLSDAQLKTLTYNYAIMKQRVNTSAAGKDQYRLKRMIQNAKIYKEITGSR